MSDLNVDIDVRIIEWLIGDPHDPYSLAIRQCYGHRLPQEPMWLVKRYALTEGPVLNVRGKWEDQPLPSNRDDEFYKRCRFESFQQAVLAATKAIGK